jgi:hypothetical protein
MNYSKFKRDVLQAAIEKHKTVIDDFQARIDSLLESEPVVNESDLEYGAQSQTAEAIITKVNPLGDQLLFANQELKLLYDMLAHKDDVHDRVELGAIVVTDKDTFFVSASIERFTADGRSVFGLSTEAPLYKEMEAKKEGDSFTYGKTTYTIKEIF